MFNSGFRGKRAKDGEGTVGQQSQYIQTNSPQPGISGWSISGTDDLALNPTGGQTVLVNGGGFASGCAVTLDGATISPVTVVSPTQISFTSPAKSGGSYTLIVYNSSGGAAILIPGLTYSSIPTFTTSAGSIGTVYETKPISTSVVATSDSSLTYSLASGSLPTGATLYANGVISGTAPVDSSSTTYTFSVTATDAELQDVTRTFTLTINTDVVSWVTPSSGSTITLDGTAYSQSLSASDAAGYAVSYTANSLPTGLSLSSGTISGTPTVEGTSSTLLTATAATTGRNSNNTITWVVALSDTYFKYTSLLLSANGSIQTSSFVSDASINNAQLAVVGDTKAQNFNPYQHGYYSYQFNGSTDVLTISRTGGWITSGNNFTIEFWGYLTSYASNSSGTYIACPFGTSASSNGFEHGFNGTASSYTSYVFNWKGNTAFSATYTFNLNTWYHIAIVKNGTTTTIYINGVSSATTTNYSTWTDNAAMNIGELGVPSWNFWYPGYISNIRIVDGTAVYTSNFTPPTTPLNVVPNTVLLTAQSNRFVDGTTNNYAFTVTSAPKVTSVVPFTQLYKAGEQYYSTYFDGTGDYLTIANSSVFNFNANDFTIECWVYPTAAGTLVGFIQQWQTGGQFVFRRNTSNRPEFVYYIGSNITVTGTSTTINANVWSHVAVVRYGSSIKMYVNGVADAATSTFAGSLLTTDRPVKIGVEGDLNGPLAGYISNARIVNGTAIYTSNFTPSTIPLTAVANTVLLTCKDNVHKDSSTNNFTITVTGDAKPVRTSPFTPSSYTNTQITTYGSGYFDGSGDNLTVPSGPFVFGTGDFTVEAWIYTPSYSNGFTGEVVVDNWPNSPGSYITGQWQFWLDSNGVVRFDYATGVSATAYVGTGTAPLNQWNHIAVTRSGTTVTVFVNGVSSGTGTVSISLGVAYAGSIGRQTATSNAYYYKGNIADVRVINGTALYISNFIPQFTSPLTNVSKTQLLTLQYNGYHNNSTFNDSSIFNNVITRNGNVTNGTFSPYGDNWSNYFSSATLATPATHTVFAAANEDFTVECWFYLTSSPGTHSMIAGYNVSPWDYWEVNTTGMGLNMNNNYNAGCLYTFALNTWYHVAFSRVSNSIKCYINGVWQSTNTVTNSFGVGTAALKLGNWCTTPNYYFPGYISNFRFIKGTGLYTTTTNFAVPTSPLTAVANTRLLTCQSNGFVDNSFMQYALTNTSTVVQKFSPFGTVTLPKYYSTYFPGASNSITFTGNTSTIVTGGDWTFEAWIYLSSANSETYPPILKDTSASWGLPLLLAGSNNSNKTINCQVGSSTSASGPSYVTVDTWHHVASVRNGTSITVFLDGVPGTPITNDITLGATPTWVIGSDGSTRFFNGYISNVRITKGQALYTGTFTPPTAPFTTTTVGAAGANVASSLTGTVAFLGLQSNITKDNSTNAFILTQTGTSINLFTPFTPTASSITSYSPTVFGGSMYFDGTGDYLQTATGLAHTDITQTDYTVECWVYNQGAGAERYIFSQRGSGTGWEMRINATNTLSFFFTGGTTFTSATTIPANAWTHIAVARVGTAMSMYINGVKDSTGSGTQTNGSSAYSSYGLWLGYGTTGGGLMLGYISDARVIKGVALYTGNFYPDSIPATPTVSVGKIAYSSTYLLNGTSSGVIDATRTVDLETVGDAKVTQFSPYNGSYYSNYFDGTGDYLTIPDNAAFEIALNTDFTVEAWFYSTAFNTYNDVITKGAAGVYEPYYIFTNSSGNLLYYSSSNGSSWNIASGVSFGTTALNQWYHVAVSRQGTDTRLFLNGALITTIANSGAALYNNSTAVGIGGRSDGTETFTGFISNARIVNGAAVYTSAFTPSTVPLTAVSGTSLLTCQSNKFVDNSTNNFTITRNGDVKVATQNPFQVNTGISYYFDGTGDYLKTSTSVATQFTSTGPLTFECWFYKTVSTGATEQAILGASTSGSLTIDISNASVWIGRNSVAFITQPAYTEQLGQWVHLAVTRGSSNDYRVFINGSQIGTTVTDSNSLPDSATWYIGQNGSLARPFYGYITDVRFTRGVARYTSTFTPPTSPVKTN